MHQHERERCARNRRTVETLKIIADETLGVRNLVKAAHMAAQAAAHGDDLEAIAEVLETVGHRLAAIAEKAERASRQEGNTDAA